MGSPVKADLRAVRRAETEARLVVAATELFLERGYAATTLTDVATHAGLAARTLYLRFESKAALLLRCVGVAIAGDHDAAPIAERAWMVAAMEGSTLDERLARMADVTASLMDRAGGLLAVAQQAAGVEPAIAVAAQAGRDATAATLREFWRRLAADGLLPAGGDLDWLTETATLLAHADTYLVLRQTTGWDVPTYRAWLHRTWATLVVGATRPS